MRIDLVESVLNLLPTSLQKKSVEEYIRSLAVEIPKAHNGFELFSYDAKYKANANASVISLEHHINREFDVKAEITELDGKPVDFLVTIDGNVDEIRLRYLIDSYKLAGKSYVFRIGDVAYTANFIDYECENIITRYTSEFIEYECEAENNVYFTVVVLPKENSGAANEFKWQIKVNSTRNVRSDIRLTVYVPCKYGNGEDKLAITNVHFQTGDNEAYSDLAIYETNATFSQPIIQEINPNYDDYYNYNKN